MNAIATTPGVLAERTVSVSPMNKLRAYRDLQSRTENAHGMAFVEKPDGSRVIAIKSLDGESVVTIPTRITESQYDEILTHILPIPETRFMMHELGLAYANGQPIMLEGGTAIGKTFAVNCFAELLYGRGAKIPDFYCNGQTDVSELMGKYVPAGLSKAQLAELDKYLKSDAGAALRAEMRQESGTIDSTQLIERAALALNLPVQKGSFMFQLGVLPKAMTGTMSPEGIMIETPDGPGCMMHVQEAGMAAPSVINALLKIRGTKGKLATDIQVHEDGGRLIQAGEGFFLVFSTNPPGKGFKERFELDSALARALKWVALPDELSKESMDTVGRLIFDCSKVERRPQSPGAFIDLRECPELAEHLGAATLAFHLLYADKLREGEPGRRQKIPPTIDSLWKVAEALQNHQIPCADRDGVDFIATLMAAVQGHYINALRDKPGIVTPQRMANVAGEAQSLGAALQGSLEAILTARATGEIDFRGKKQTRAEVIETLAEEAMAGAGEMPTAAAVVAEAREVAAGHELKEAMGLLENLLGTGSMDDLKKRVGV